MSRPDPDADGALSLLLLAALGTAADHLVLLDAEARITWANRSLLEFIGAMAGGLAGRRFDTLASPVDRATTVGRIVHQVMETAQPGVFEGMCGGVSGLRFIEYALTPIVPPRPGAAMLVVGRDVTTRRHQLAALRESEEFFRLIFEHGPVGVMIASADRRILRVNSRFAEIAGYTEAELSACRIDDLSPHEDFVEELPQLQRLQAGGMEAYQAERRLTRKDGREVWTQVTRTVVVDAEQEVLFIVSLTEDIDARKRAESERHAMEERLRERQKLESLGLLAGGIAHDLNNLLVPILGNAELALRELPATSPQRGPVEEILVASQRAARIAHQMQAYSGRGHFVMAPLDLSAVIREMSTVLRASLSSPASLRVEAPPALPTIRGDAAQMRQIVFNLVQNAGEALATGGGTVTVSTGRRMLSRPVLESLYVPADLPEGEYIYLRVSDSGAGMAPEVRARLFDPFLSTKGPGRGLGLPAVLGVARGHGGALQVESDPRTGTTITVYFPADAAHRATVSEGDPGRDQAAHRHGPGGVVLVVEDDAAVRGLAARTLERAGYVVHTANDGVEALEYLAAPSRPVSCVVLDLVLPRLHGGVVSRKIKTLTPGVPIIIMSGYTEQLSGEIAAMAAHVLQKPFTPQTLRDAVGTAIASNGFRR